jgi:protein TonB
LSGSVPISIGAHLVVLLLLLIVPLAADIALPMPDKELPEFIRVAPAPPPPPPAPSPVAVRARTSVAADQSVAPTTAPPRIEPELASAGPPLDAPLGLSAGVPAGFGIDTGAVTVTLPPSPEPPRQTTVRVAQLPEPPRKIIDVRPVYPEIARTARVEGTVILESVLDTSGNVTQLRVVRSVPLLDQAALNAVRQWKYSPTLYGGRPVSVLMTITIRFTLNQ